MASTMYGFRPHLSTQDVLLQLKECVINNLSTKYKSAILALDVKRAFDNVFHCVVLYSLYKTDCGQKTYNYVQDFLTDWTATVGLAHLITASSESLRKEPIRAP